MNKLNCWDVMKCEYQPRTDGASRCETCPALTEKRTDGVHEGLNGGRACWAITGTLCHGTVQGIFASKLGLCMQCPFYKLVIAEEGRNYKFADKILPLMT